MTDTATVWDVANARGDWVLAGSQFATGDDLATAILISVFTDRMANSDDVIPDGSNDPRGWSGDLGETVPIGSRMWLLSRAKQTQQTLNDAFDYLTEAVQWLIDDGVAARIDITTEWTRPSMLGAQIVAWKQDGTNIAMKFTWAWQGIS